MAPSSAPQRPIDRALTLAAAQEPASALRYALPVLQLDSTAALPLFVVGHSLAALGRRELAARALKAAGRRAIDISSLPLAVASAAELRTLGEEVASLLDAMATAFGRGSPRLRDRRLGPPELPGVLADFAPLDEAVSEEELERQAGELLTAAEAALDAGSEEAAKTPLSPQPLFSSLTPESLREMIAIFEVQVLAAGATLVQEGTVGAEAFIVARGELDVQRQAPRDGDPPLHLARLGAGSLVGEMALLSRAPRAATVVTVRPSVILVGHKAALDGVVARVPQVGQQFAEHCKRRMVDNLVRTSALFRAASPAERPSLVERFGVRTFEPGESLIKQGQNSEGLHLIASGEVSIVHQDQDDRTLLTKLGPGDVAGEVALLLRRPAIADAIAQHPTVTLFLPADRLFDLLRAHPKVFADLYELAVQRDQETASVAREEATQGEDFVFI